MTTDPPSAPRSRPTPGRGSRSGRGLRPVATLMTVVAVTVGAGSCGVPIDEAPRAISRTTLDPAIDDSRVTPTTSDRPGAAHVTAYFVGSQRLEGHDFAVEGQATLEAALAFTLGEAPEGLTTALPTGTRILSTTVESGVATLDLSAEINDVSGQSQKQAYAQLAFTTFTTAGVAQVRFLVTGKPVDAPTDNGNKSVVTPSDFTQLRPAF